MMKRWSRSRGMMCGAVFVFLMLVYSRPALGGAPLSATGSTIGDGMVIKFSNLSDRIVHAVFCCRRPDFVKILEAAGWTQEAFDALLDVYKAYAPTVMGMVATSQGVPSGVGQAIGSLSSTILQSAIGNLPGSVGGASAISEIKEKDYFRQVFPLCVRYSYRPNTNAVENARNEIRYAASFESKFTVSGQSAAPRELYVVIFADASGLPDLSKIEYAGRFKLGGNKYNAVQYGYRDPLSGEIVPGRVLFYYINPKDGKIGKIKEKTGFFPVSNENGVVTLTDEGGEAARYAGIEAQEAAKK